MELPRTQTDREKIKKLLSWLNAPQVDEVEIVRNDPRAKEKLEPLNLSVMGESINPLIDWLNSMRAGEIPAGLHDFSREILNHILARCRFFPQLSVKGEKRVEWHAAPEREEVEQRLDLGIQEILSFNDRDLLWRFRKCENESCRYRQKWFYAWNEKKRACCLACSKAISYRRMIQRMTPAQKERYNRRAKKRMDIQRENARKRELAHLKLTEKKR